MSRELVVTDKAFISSNPLSQALRVSARELLYCSGQLPIDPATGAVVEGGIAAQTKRVLENLSAILAAGGTSMEHVVKVTVFLTDIRDAAEMNSVYRSYFPHHPPTRSCVEVGGLARPEARLEIELVAIVPGPD